MMISKTSTDYFINSIPERKNGNEYISIDKTIGTIEIKNNKWYYNLDFYIYNNFNLPINIFNFDLTTDSQSISSLTMNKSVRTTNTDYYSIYSASFIVDTNDDNFLLSNLHNEPILHYINFNIDAEILKNFSTEITQQQLDSLMLELYEENQTWTIDYTNYYFNDFKSIGDFNVSNNLSFDTSTNESKWENKIVRYEVPQSHNIDVLTRFVSLNSNVAFNIISNSVSVNYASKTGLIKTLDYEVMTPTNKIYTYDLDFAYKTCYNQGNDEVVLSLDGIGGFSCPYQTNGYYLAKLIIEIEGRQYLISFTNTFTLNSNENSYIISSTNIVINNLSGYKRIVF